MKQYYAPSFVPCQVHGGAYCYGHRPSTKLISLDLSHPNHIAFLKQVSSYSYRNNEVNHYQEAWNDAQWPRQNTADVNLRNRPIRRLHRTSELCL